MVPAVRLLALALLALVVGDGLVRAQPPAASLPAPAALSVTLTSGRTFTGGVDPRTSDAALVLRFQRGGGALLRRTIEWNRIFSAAIGEEPVPMADLRTKAEELKLPDASPSSISDLRSPTSDLQLPTPDSRPPTPVTSITFDARMANWDGDVETDGLLVDVVPLDSDQSLTPVRGTVEVELFAPHRRIFQHAPQSYGATFDLVERWSRPIRPEDFTSSGIRLRLPFGAVHPEFNQDWFGYGLVHVRLVAPGHGVFDDSRDAVRIRPWAPNRDQQELKSYPRFLPTEAVGRHN